MLKKNNVELCIRLKGETRLIQPLNFSHLPVSAKYFLEEIPINSPLKTVAKAAIDDLLKKRPDVFIFFQEMDPLMLIITSQ